MNMLSLLPPHPFARALCVARTRRAHGTGVAACACVNRFCAYVENETTWKWSEAWHHLSINEHHASDANNMRLPTNMKHLLNDGLPGERPPKRHSTSPPSLPTFSSPLTPTPADEMEDCTVIATHSTPPKSISEHYTYFSEQGEDSTPTETRGGHVSILAVIPSEDESRILTAR